MRRLGCRLKRIFSERSCRLDLRTYLEMMMMMMVMMEGPGYRCWGLLGAVEPSGSEIELKLELEGLGSGVRGSGVL